MTQLVDIERPLALFAEGIAGHYCHLKIGEEEVADRTSVYLPESIELFEDDEANAAVFRLRVLVQLGFHEFGTFEFDIDVARERIPELAARERPESHRESDLTVFFNHFEAPALARRLFQILELARVEARALSTYPGARKYHRALAPHVPPPPNYLAPVLDEVRAPHADVYTTAEATVACYEALSPEASPYPSREFPAQMEWLQREARLTDWEEELDRAAARITAFELAAEAGEVQVGDGQADGEIRDIGRDLVRERDQLQRRIDMERSALRHRLGDAHDAAQSFRYDEWDYHAHGYRRGWCRLFEEALAPDDDAESARLIEAVRPHAHAVRRRFEQIRPAGYQRVAKVVDGDELDLNTIVDVRSDLRAGVSADDRVYSRRDRLRRDVGAAFLVDLSASTDDPVVEKAPAAERSSEAGATPAQNLRDPWFDDDDDPYAALDHPPGAPERRRIIDIQKEAVTLLATALEGIGDRYSVYGFSGYGRDCVEFYVAKEFDQPLDRRAIDAIAAMKPKRSTRMGPAIRHATAKLEASGATLKVLMIVSDGFPQDCDYGPTRGDHEYGLRDTAKALEEAERAGVYTFCITVDRSGHDYLRRMCPDARYMVIEETEELPTALQKAYRRLTQV
ncbi:MAG: hypothetical protein F4X99_11505 [Gammaproteobacteria bacterium]|nr:hypothetical protein [Gammaproteobacteria bacterium]